MQEILVRVTNENIILGYTGNEIKPVKKLFDDEFSYLLRKMIDARNDKEFMKADNIKNFLLSCGYKIQFNSKACLQD